MRLWIELLKNAYYKTPTELETLPNIDINIKNGNSLISRFALDSDLKTALKKSKISIEDYKKTVADYRNAVTKEQKWKLEKLIDEIKHSFRTEISKNSKEIVSLNKLRAEYYTKYESSQLFEAELTKAQQKDKYNLEAKIQKTEDFIEGSKIIKFTRMLLNGGSSFPKFWMRKEILSVLMPLSEIRPISSYKKWGQVAMLYRKLVTKLLLAQVIFTACFMS